MAEIWVTSKLAIYGALMFWISMLKKKGGLYD